MNDLIERAQDADKFATIMGDICAEFGFDYGAYLSINPVTGDLFPITNYSLRWQRIYRQKELQFCDTTMLTAAKSIVPVDWSTLPRDNKYERTFSLASDFGITPNGVTIPIRDPYGDTAFFSVTQNTSPTHWNYIRNKHIADLQMLAVVLHQTVTSHRYNSDQQMSRALSPRERECLRHIAAGLRQHEVAQILDISVKTVELHTRMAREKLGASSTAHAVARAIAFKLITPQ